MADGEFGCIWKFSQHTGEGQEEELNGRVGALKSTSFLNPVSTTWCMNSDKLIRKLSEPELSDL